VEANKRRQLTVKVFVKYFFLGIVSQVLTIVAFLLLGSLSNSRAHPIQYYFRLYEPFGALIAMALPGHGESHMIAAGFLGILLGVIFYSVAFGLVVTLIKQR
jgi:hypothetical protein